MRQTSDRQSFRYEPEADVLSWEVSNQPIDYSKEVGNIVVHFSKDRVPVLIEILEANKFLAESTALMKRHAKHN